MMGLNVVIDDNAGTTHPETFALRENAGQNPQATPPDDADAIERPWRGTSSPVGAMACPVRRSRSRGRTDADGWILTLEVMPGTIAANAATLIPAHIDLQLGV
jgi:hypothetical protein